MIEGALQQYWSHLKSFTDDITIVINYFAKVGQRDKVYSYSIKLMQVIIVVIIGVKFQMVTAQ